MKSQATSIAAYLDELSPERRAVVEPVLALVRANLPAGYEEAMNWGMICWQVPLRVAPHTYNGQPLMFAALASQKNYVSLYLSGIHSFPAYHDRIMHAGKKLKLGKGCINFTAPEELPLEVIAEILRSCSVEEFVTQYEAVHMGLKKKE